MANVEHTSFIVGCHCGIFCRKALVTLSEKSILQVVLVSSRIVGTLQHVVIFVFPPLLKFASLLQIYLLVQVPHQKLLIEFYFLQFL